MASQVKIFPMKTSCIIVKISQIISISAPTLSIPGRISAAKYEIVFETLLPALGFITYYFQAKSMDEIQSRTKVTVNQACVLQNQVISIH